MQKTNPLKKKIKIESRAEKAERLKRRKPYKSCTWYPGECNAAGCDCGEGQCRDYKEDWGA